MRFEWIEGIDAVSGVRLLINTAHIVAFRESRNSTYVVTSCGLEYAVEGSLAALKCTNLDEARQRREKA